jgi:hypothetical protein
MMRPSNVVLLLGVLASGCVYSRVTLPPVPAVDAPLTQRQAAFRSLSIISDESTRWSMSNRPNVTLKTDLEWVTLGDGTQVEDPRDLASAVLPNSQTARLLAAYENEVHQATNAKLIVLTSSVVALGASIAFFAAGAAASQNRQPGAAELTTVGVFLSFPGILGMFLGTLMRIAPDSGTRATAFLRYNDDLAERLGLR